MEKSQVSQYKTWVEVDSHAILHNLRAVQKHVGKDVTVMCVLKSNAYGHGLVEVASLFSNVRSPTPDICMSGVGLLTWFGVDSIDEALTLKKVGIKNPIFILGYIPKVRLADAIKNGFRFMLYDMNVLKECARIAKCIKKKAYVHIKVETGTWRQGITRPEISTFANLLRAHTREIVPEGIYTHFADTENAKSAFYKEQMRVFEECVSLFQELRISPRYRHMAASAATLLYPETHGNMVRLGISLYGLYPSEDVRHQVSAVSGLQLKPALTWKARVAQVKRVLSGNTIGYDRSFTVLKPMKLAVIPVGYWDGFDRRLSNKGSILIGGKRCSVVGRVCMNMMMVDVTGVLHVVAGDEVVLLGTQGRVEIAVDEIAAQSNTINYEIVTRINPLILRFVR